MKVSSFVKKLVEKQINTKLLIEFYREVAETEKLFYNLVEDITDPIEIEGKKIGVAAIERFCEVLQELQESYAGLDTETVFASEASKRDTMISNAARFVNLLEDDCNIKLPDRHY
jgi:uncharacterized protein with von Willebrand factor type A (vWA) domain